MWRKSNSDLPHPERDNYLAFRSSRYGNASHSHNNQNAFAISSGGHSLAISSGYYPRYGSPHHDNWTRQTEAHNCVTVDGVGQDRGIHATGELAAFANESGYTYLRGEAGAAYPDTAVTRFDRHILFVEPGLYLICDDLAAPTPSSFEWHLHTHENPDIDHSTATIRATRGPARLRARLFGPTQLSVNHFGGFDPGPNEGLIEELQIDRPDQHHVTVNTEPRDSAKMLGILTAWQGSEPEVSVQEQDGALTIEGCGFSGTVTLADGPPQIRGTIINANDATESVEFP